MDILLREVARAQHPHGTLTRVHVMRVCINFVDGCRSSGHACPATVGAQRRSAARKRARVGCVGVPEPPLAARPEAAARGGESGP